ncbi:preprotein translocase subunit YajC [Eubacterium multiforme]|uniref:Preprotein translocase subunit YajC n=1 Tax=Eubacterium multiforme TaxID=83339 RepID=A0ABT9UVS7_9FIRM|nr:preprotein translocase subunit YajC [Eubacterium multiforme]MDQ0150417.1 preprotein translocase subunit YajC [Eubacterium multiforme]
MDNKLVIWLIVLFAAYPVVVLMIMPLINKKRMAKQGEEREKALSSLKIGDKIVTISGIYGRIRGINKNIVKLEIAEKTVIEIDKASIIGALKEQ